MYSFFKSSQMPDPERALPDRSQPIEVVDKHFVNANPIKGPYPSHMDVVYFGLGCFWGAERKFWSMEGVYTTAVGYCGGYTRHPTYQDVCSGRSGHTEAVMVVYDPSVVQLETLLKVFWESHDPTQGMRQGHDVGTQYRSAIYTNTSNQLQSALDSRDHYASKLIQAGRGKITTEIADAKEFFFAEDYHQQYLAKNPNGYCGIGGTGVKYA